jgi:hypothetical protein
VALAESIVVTSSTLSDVALVRPQAATLVSIAALAMMAVAILNMLRFIPRSSLNCYFSTI